MRIDTLRSELVKKPDSKAHWSVSSVDAPLHASSTGRHLKWYGYRRNIALTFHVDRTRTFFQCLLYVIVKAGKECCRQYNGTRGRVKRARQRHRLMSPKALHLFCRGRTCYNKGIREAKALTVAAKSPCFISVEAMFVTIEEFAKQRRRPLPSKVSTTFRSR